MAGRGRDVFFVIDIEVSYLYTAGNPFGLPGIFKIGFEITKTDNI